MDLKTTLSFLLLGALSTVYSQNRVTLEEKSIVMPTYTVAPAEKNPIFFRNEAYQGASRHYYPLRLNDQYTHERIEKPWNFVILKNEFVELGILPEIGGKLYYATDKTNNYNFVYKNSVVKPSNIGMTGAWVSGGIEWCVPHHHRASTFLPINYTTAENPDGSKTVWVAEHEPRHGMRWTIGVTLFPGKSYFKVQGRIFNASPFTHTFLFWANVAAHANKDYQAVFPPDANIAVYHSKTDFVRWPVSREVFRESDFTAGVDISRWKNVEKSNSFFVHDLKSDFMGGYDHGKDAGTVHIGDHNIVKGAKLWEWGSGERGQATEARLTETDGPYVEIMVGAYSDNQPDYSWIRPYEVKEWEQYWYPVKGIKGFKNATLNGAVNLEKNGDNTVYMGFYATQNFDRAKVVLKSKNNILFEKNIRISPDAPFSETIKLKNNYEIRDLYAELVDIDTEKIIVSYQPEILEEVRELPETWKGYPSPENVKTVEELFLTGQRVEQFYAPEYNPLDWYMEALRRDPGDIRSNTAVGNIYLKNGDYPAARKYLGKAVERLTKDYTRPSTCEPIYLQGLALRALGLLDEAADTLYRATWDYAWHSAAYYQLAQLSVMRGNNQKALDQVNKSLSTNAGDNRAVALKAALLRQLGRYDEALAAIDPILKNDPLDFRIRNEYCLLLADREEVQQAEIELCLLEKQMRDFDDNYLELAVSYINDGFLREAEEVLLRVKNDNPIVCYYLGYVKDKLNDKGKAKLFFGKAAGLPTDYVFPYRLETAEVLKTALNYNPADGKAHYYLGNILYQKQPEKAMEHWFDAVKYAPGLSVAFRNVGWGYNYFRKDIEQAISYYEQAVSINKNEPIYYSELDALYEQNNAPVEARLKLFEGNETVVKNRDDAFIRLIDVLTLAGRSDKAVELLQGAQFAYREGTSNVREITINAQLMQGLRHYENREYDKALDYFLRSQVPEEEAGSARLGNRAIQVYYYTGLAYRAMKQAEEASAYFLKAVSLATADPNVMDYYKGLAYRALNDEAKAETTFRDMIEYASRNLQGETQTAAGIIFGKRESERSLQSVNHTIRGLAYKGLQEKEKAIGDLNDAVALLKSNLWATVELNKWEID